jgi:prepilin-type N-terminal cleavage/methylation domain-containing protein
LFKHKKSGFTIVELLIVVVVIAVLATITVVAYTNFQERARTSAADSTLTQAAKKLALYKAEQESYPASLDDAGIDSDETIALDYSASSGGYCLAATVADITRRVSAASHTPTSGSCAAALSKWQFTGGITYDGTTDQIRLNESTNGAATAPLVATEGKDHARLTVETYATVPSGYKTPNSGLLFRSHYFASDKVTSAQNPQGYASNGNGTCTSTLNTWSTCTFTVNTGENVSWVRFTIDASGATRYSSDNILRNIQITVFD